MGFLRMFSPGESSFSRGVLRFEKSNISRQGGFLQTVTSEMGVSPTFVEKHIRIYLHMLMLILLY